MRRLSIVVPALNEAERIACTLAPLAPLRERGHELIVVDGASRDATAASAAPFADRVLVATRGRAVQMNVGAAFARGDTLLFLHADTRLPDGADQAIERAFARGRRWGRFDVTIEGRSSLLPLVSRAMNLRSRATGIATGDQAIFVSRALFEALGGYPVQPLMEDIALSRALKRRAGRPACLAERVVTSGRRWDSHGALATIGTMWSLRYAYWRGRDPSDLARRYGAASPAKPATLIVFAREPVPGRVKTRLAAAIGDREAASLYRSLVEQTLQTAERARALGIVGRVELHGTPDVASAAFAAWRDRFGVELVAQRGDDLGARMRNALFGAIARGTSALLVGTDCPTLDVEGLARAAAALADHGAVLAPAEDGGYVLVGLSRAIDVFGGIAWSTPGVMADTRARLASLGERWHELPVTFDIDTEADLARWRALRGECAPAAA